MKHVADVMDVHGAGQIVPNMNIQHPLAIQEYLFLEFLQHIDMDQKQDQRTWMWFILLEFGK